MTVRRIWMLLLMMAALALPLSAQDEALTIQADEALLPAVEALVAAFEGDVRLVDADADVLATTDRKRLPEASPLAVAPHFLPGAFLVLEEDSAAADAFAQFAVSPAGQQALIAAGLLPSSITVTDQAGNAVEIPQPVHRAITPFSLATYLVYGVNAEDRLVAGGFLGARTPIGAERMTAIDPRFPELSAYTMTLREINLEEVAALAPDVIFASSRSAWLDTIAELDIPVVLFRGETPELLKEAMRLAGQIFGPHAMAYAEAWIAYYEDILRRVIADTAGITEAERPSVLIVGEEALRVISGDMYQTDIIAAAGGRSVSEALTGAWNDVNLEQIAVWNPEVIVIVPYGTVTPQMLRESPEWQMIRAVQDGRVYKMPSWVAPWDTPVPDSVMGIIWLAQTLFPERSTLDCAAEGVRFYEAFYDIAIPQEELAAVCAAGR